VRVGLPWTSFQVTRTPGLPGQCVSIKAGSRPVVLGSLKHPIPPSALGGPSGGCCSLSLAVLRLLACSWMLQQRQRQRRRQLRWQIGQTGCCMVWCQTAVVWFGAKRLLFGLVPNWLLYGLVPNGCCMVWCQTGCCMIWCQTAVVWFGAKLLWYGLVPLT
jgi:hypothetical protein